MKRKLARNCGKAMISIISQAHIKISIKCHSLIHHSNVEHSQDFSHSLHHATREQLNTVEEAV